MGSETIRTETPGRVGSETIRTETETPGRVGSETIRTDEGPHEPAGKPFRPVEVEPEPEQPPLPARVVPEEPEVEGWGWGRWVGRMKDRLVKRFRAKHVPDDVVKEVEEILEEPEGINGTFSHEELMEWMYGKEWKEAFSNEVPNPRSWIRKPWQEPPNPGKWVPARKGPNGKWIPGRTTYSRRRPKPTGIAGWKKDGTPLYYK